MGEDILANMDEMEKDALKEVGNVGAGNAATAFAQFLDRKVDMTVPSVKIIPLSEAQEITGDSSEVVAGVLLKVMGEAPATILFMVAPDSVEHLVQMVADKEVDFEEMEEVDISALKEIGNILSGSYLNALNKMTGFNLVQSVPDCAVDMAGAIISTSLIPVGKTSDYTMLIETQFIDQGEKIEGYFLLIPHSDSLQKILNALGFDV